MTDEQWEAITNHDASFDGIFYYGVKTTGIVCRPSCTTRQCNRENAVVFDTLDEARAAGYRMCLRCRPDNPEWRGARYDLTEKAKRYIEAHYLDKFSLDDLAGELFVNKSYLLRVFRAETCTTPLQYHNGLRCDKAKEMLVQRSANISMIGYRVGFSSASHFTRVFKSIEGCTPSQYAKEHRQ